MGQELSGVLSGPSPPQTLRNGQWSAGCRRQQNFGILSEGTWCSKVEKPASTSRSVPIACPQNVCAPEVSCLSPFSVSQQDHLQREGTDVLGHRKLS